MKAPSNLIHAKLDHIIYLCRNMRPDEVEQLHAFMSVEDEHGDYDPDVLAAYFIAKTGPKFTVVGADGFPAVCGGYDMVAEGVWQSWMVGSMSGWETNWRSITKSTRWLMSTLFATGAHRLQTSAIGSRCRAHEWYVKSLKMKHEGIQRGFGRNGEDVYLFGVLAGEL